MGIFMGILTWLIGIADSFTFYYVVSHPELGGLTPMKGGIIAAVGIIGLLCFWLSKGKAPGGLWTAIGAVLNVINVLIGAYIGLGDILSKFSWVLWIALVLLVIPMQRNISRVGGFSIFKVSPWWLYACICDALIYAIFHYAPIDRRYIKVPVTDELYIDFVPTLENIPQWSIELKLLTALAILATVVGLISALRRTKLAMKYNICIALDFLIGAKVIFLLHSLFDGWIVTSLLWCTLIEGFFWVFVLIFIFVFPFVKHFPGVAGAFAEGMLSSSGVGTSGTTQTSKQGVAALPMYIYDSSNNRWQRYGVYGDHADYQSQDGDTVTIYNADVSGNTASTSAGNFHWY